MQNFKLFNASTPTPATRQNWLRVFFGSTSDYRPSGGKYVYRCVDICVPNMPTRQALKLVLVFKLPSKFKPRTIRNRLRQLSVLDHVGNPQVFDNDQTLGFHDFSCLLVSPIKPNGGNLLVDIRNPNPCSVPPIRALYSTGKDTLSPSKFGCVSSCSSNVFNVLPVAIGSEVCNTHVDANLCVSFWHLPIVFVDAYTDKVFAGRGSTDRYCGWFRFELSRPTNVQSTHLCDGQVAVSGIPFESGLSELSRLVPRLLFKRRVSRTLGEKVTKSCIQVSQALLKRHARDVFKPSGFFVLFPRSQFFGCVSKRSPLAGVFVGVSSMSQSTIVNVPNTTKRLSKDLLLFGRGVKTVLIGFDRHGNPKVPPEVVTQTAQREPQRMSSGDVLKGLCNEIYVSNASKYSQPRGAVFLGIRHIERLYPTRYPSPCLKVGYHARKLNDYWAICRICLF